MCVWGGAGVAARGRRLRQHVKDQMASKLIEKTTALATTSDCKRDALRCRCMCYLCSCSLSDNGMGAAGAAAIGAGLVHLPQLQSLKYVVCSAACAGPWHVLARERGAMACVCAVLLCVRFVLVQP